MVKVMNQSEPVVEQGSTRELISAAWIGAVVGVLTWTLTYVLSHYVIGSIACRVGSSLVDCADAVTVAAGIALVISSVVGLVLLVRERAFRPLLVILAALVTLWGLYGAWLEVSSILTIFGGVIVTALVYTVLTWFSRVRNFWVSLGIIIVLTILFRLIVTL